MTRRELLARTGCGFGLAAVAGIMEGAEANPLLPKPAPLPAKAKSVIYLHMHGGVSHVDTFDPKPELTKYTGKPLSAELAKIIKTSFIHDPSKAILRGSPWEFRPGGQSGRDLHAVPSAHQGCSSSTSEDRLPEPHGA